MLKKQSKPKSNKKNLIILAVVLSNMLGSSYCSAANVATLGELQTVTTDTSTKTRDASLTTDITVPNSSSIGTAGAAGAGTVLTINGNPSGTAYSITGAGAGNNSSGWIVNSSNITFNLKNVGATSGSAITKAVQNFVSAGNGSVLNISAGTANITNSIIYNNSSTGGAIYNPSTVNIGTSGSTDTTIFANNYSSGDGGVVYNRKVLNSYTGVTYAGNYTAANAKGGAIYNRDNTSIATIQGNTFKYNGYSDYNYATNTATTVQTQNGGAIYNESLATLKITNSIFTNNAATVLGGAICNQSSVGLTIGTSGLTDTTSFTSNRAQNGGAIYNGGIFNSYAGVTFAGNYASGFGGAIYNSGASAVATIDGNTFKWNGYNNYNSGTDTASVISSDSGGAIFNLSSAQLNISNSIFRNNAVSAGGGAIYNNTSGIVNVTKTIFDTNSANSSGGAIYNNSGTVNIGISGSTDTTSFVNNKATTNQGGAIWNNKILNSYAGVTYAGNYTGSGIGGGAINNTGASSIATIIGNTFKWNGYSDYNSGTDTASTSSTKSGGAIYNTGVGTITNSTFKNNAATINGGAIYNSAGFMNIISDIGLTLFTGNKVGGISNAIYTTGGMVNLNSGNGGYLLFNDKITGTAGSNVYINQTGDNTATTGYLASTAPTDGNVIFNDSISTVNLNLKGGQLILGQYGNTHLTDASGVAVPSNSGVHTYLNNVALTLSGGTLNTANNYLDTNYVSSLSASGGAKIIFDTDLSLSSNNSDKLVVAGTTSGPLTLQGMNIMKDSAGTSGTIDFLSSGSFNTFSTTALNTYTNHYLYTVAAGTDSGTLNYTRTGDGVTYDGLYSAVAVDTLASRTFSATTDTVLATSLDAMGLAGSTLNIFGNGYNINGNNYSGITVGSDQTLNISNVGSVTNGTSWNGSFGQNGTCINNSGQLSISNSVFSSDLGLGIGAGALLNDYLGRAYITNSTFENNSSTYSAGAIYNTYELTLGTSGLTDTTSFLNNFASSIGGAIYNDGVFYSFNGITYAGNHTGNNGFGGAIYNSTDWGRITIEENTFKYNGYSDYDPNTNTAATVSTQYGGAIFSTDAGSLKIVNSNFINNAASTRGGAIYNDATAITYLQADGVGKQTIFQGNLANGVSNAIYLAGTDANTNSSNLYLNAGNSGIITIHDGIEGSNTAYNNIYINSSDATASTSFIDGSNILTNGVVNLYDNITGATIYDYAGTTNFGDLANAKTGCYNGTIFNLSGGIQNLNNGATGSTFNLTDATLNVSSTGSITNSELNLNSGTLNLVNGKMDTIGLTNFNANAAGTLHFDADLNAGTNDKITVSGIAAGELVSAINITQASNTPAALLTLVTGSNISGLTLKDTIVTYTNYGKYTFTGSTNGVYSVALEAAEGINEAVANNTLISRSFSATGDTTVTGNLGPMGMANSTLDIFGNSHDINGIGYSGVSVASGQTLNISGVGSFAGGESWNGFTITGDGGAISNSGTTSILNSVFTNNTATNNGGVILNNDTLNIGTFSSTDTSMFIKNSSTNNGGAIYNTKILNSYSGVTFAGNYNAATGYGGAIYNTSATAVATIIGNTFKWNGYSDYNSATNTASTVSTQRGGAIYNSSSAQMTILNSTFSNNATSNNGGAILNVGTLNIGTSGSTDSTSFINNKSTSAAGGAIYNNKTINSYDGVTFAGNYTASGIGGGAIYNTGGSAVINLVGNTFKYNGYSNYNSGTDTASTVSTKNGGAIFNDTSTNKLTITNSTFTNNAATINGGAIYNTGLTLKLGTSGSTDTTNFTNNKTTTGNGGAIYNGGIMNSYAGVTFAGNSTSNSTFGGAIYATGASVVTTIDGNTFKWNGYSDYNPTTDTAVTSITNRGGAIFNDSSAQLNITNSTFNNNTSLNSGGAIANYSTVNIGTNGSTDSTSFISNRSSSGGAIWNNSGVLNLYSGVTFLKNYADSGGAIWNNKTLNSNSGITYAGNYTTSSGSGGAIYNTSATAVATYDGNIFKWNGYSDYNQATDTASTVSNKNGGAIYNATSGTTNIKNSIFNNNASTGDGGAIWNGSTVNIGTSGSTDTSSFTNNKSTTGHGGAIYNSSTLNSYSGVTFAGNYVNGTHYGGAIMNVGASAIATIVGNTFKYNGYSDYNSTTGTASTVLTFQGGAIHNDTSAQLNITNSKFNNNAATSGGGLYNIGTINIGTSGSTDSTSFINNQSSTASGGAIYNSGVLNSYAGVTFAGNYTGATGAGGAIYNIGASSTTTIDGNTFKWNGYSDYNSATDTATTISSQRGGAISSLSGTVNITNSTFTNNATTLSSGAIRNNGTLNIGTSSTSDTSSFTNNHTTGNTSGGGAISNAGTINSYSGVTLAGNYTNNTSSGGAIYNSGASAVANIDGNTFKYNGYSDYNSTTGTATTISALNGGAIWNEVSGTINITNSLFNNNGATGIGGAIFNDSTATATIKNSTFNNNLSTGNGGAIYNKNQLTIGTSGFTDTTKFTNNQSTTTVGGAIYNTGTMNSYNGVTFAGNYTNNTSSGGAIYNSGASAVATIDGNTFKYNGYSDYNSGTDTATTVSTLNGGAIYNNTSAQLNISNSTFQNNAASTAGAIYNSGNTNISNSIFQNNTASNTGAIFNVGTINIGTSGSTDTTVFIKNNITGITGGTITNNNILNSYSGVTFAGSYTNASGKGGTLYNSGSSALATIIGNTIKYSGYSDYNSATDTASTIVTKYGGGIYNISSATVNIKNSLLTNNVATYTGGGINNSGSTINLGTSGSTDTTILKNNYATSYGGAIWNNSVLNSYNGVTFAGNYTGAAGAGGAIYNTTVTAIANIIGNTFKWNGYSNYNSGTDTATTVAAKYGGAIYNDSSAILKIANSSFTNNAVITSGGAIYNNNASNTYIQGDGVGKQTLFQGNLANGISNAIYLAGTDATTNASNVYLNAGNSGKIVSYDGIAGSNKDYNFININSSNATAKTSFIDGTTVLTNGEVDLYGNISDVTVNNSAGITNVGRASNPVINSTNSLWNISGGTVNVNNTAFSGTSATAGGVISNTAGTLNIGTSGLTDASTFINCSSSASDGGAIYNAGALNIYKGVLFAGNYTGNSNNGSAIYNTGASAITTIDGATFKWNGYSNYNSGTDTATTASTKNAGVIYNDASAQLIISNSIFNNNTSKTTAGVIYNTGSAQTTITNSVFSNNKTPASAGAIFNNSTVANALNIGTSGGTDTTSFINNSAITNVGGAITNNGVLNSYNGVTFAGNYTGAVGFGGAIYSAGATASAKIIGNIFKYNGYSNYTTPGGVDTASTVSTKFGGAIFNSMGSALKISNTSFTNNVATTSGGAIYDDSKSKTYIQGDGAGKQTLFQGNLANGVSNAIYLAGTDATTNASNLYLNAGNSGKVVSYDGIRGSNKDYNFININSSDATAKTSFIDGTTVLTNGEVDLYGNISDVTINNSAGITNVGRASNPVINSTNSLWNILGGTVNVNNTAFSGTSATAGGVISNTAGTLNIGTSGLTDGSTFINDSSSASNGGAIYNASALNIYKGALFAGNFTDGSHYGGAIYNSGAAAIATIDGATFKWNGYSDYNSGTDTATTISTKNGGAIYNDTSAQLSITNSMFNNNAVTSKGGAIHNNTSATLNIKNSIFNNNKANYAGAIFNDATLTIGTSGSADTTSFINNYATYGGGAVQTSGGVLTSYSGVTFAGNYTGTSANGGAIWNQYASSTATIIGNTFKWNGYSDYNSGTDTATTVATTNGGAIYNEQNGIFKIANTSFTNNASTTNGGAIYNKNSKTYIQGDGAGKQTLFQGNKAAGVSNAIYLGGSNATTNSSNLYLNAGNSGSITSYDAISGSNNAYNNIYINSSDATASTSFIDGSTVLTNGTVNLYDDVTGATVYDYAGTTNFGNSSSPKAGCYNGTIFNLSGGTQNFNNGITSATINASGGTQNLQSAIATSTINSTGGVQNLNNTMSDSSLTVNGGTLNVTSTGSIANSSLTLTSGTLNLANNKMDTIGLTNFNASSAGILNFDADLEAGTNDKITVSGIATGQLTSTVNITKDTPINGNSTLTLVTGSNISGLALQNIGPTYTTYGKYTFTGSTNGTYNVLSEWAGGLNTAVAIDKYALRTYSGTADTTVTGNLGPMGLANSTLSIYGNGYSINGAGASGVTVNSGQTLNISGVGSVADGKSWNGFVSTGDYGAINNIGTTNITNSVFSNNSATNWGGAIGNSWTGGVLNIGTSGGTDTTLFVNNHALNYHGGAISNEYILNSYNGVTFAGNYTDSRSGGAIVNSMNGVVTIVGNTFKWNGYNNYNLGTDTATTVSTKYGGAIYNNSATSKVSIKDSTFSNNASTTDGGAIWNNSTVANALVIGTSGSTDTTSFINNKATTGLGGAIYNSGILNSYAGVTFAGNSANYGGAIENSGASAVATIDGNIFKWNGYSNYNSGTDTATTVATINGGAINNENTARLNISNSTFTHNAAIGVGGAISNASLSQANITTSAFSYNKATAHGGAIYNTTGTLNLGTSGSTDTTSFINNNSVAGNGGAIYNDKTLNSYNGVLFAGNYTGNSNYGGAIMNTGASAVTTIDGNTFKYNGYSDYNSGTDTATTVSTKNGGAIYNDTSAQLSIKNSSFNNNAAISSGGAIYNAGTLTIGTSGSTDTTSFINNYSSANSASNGGAIYNSGAGVLNIYSGVSFINNKNNNGWGGAIYNNGTTNITGVLFAGNTSGSGGFGGAIFNNAGTTTITGSTFSYNGYSDYNTSTGTASTVSNRYGGAIAQSSSQSLTIKNSIFNNNASLDNGGAIRNLSTVANALVIGTSGSTDTTKFINNSTSNGGSLGGAIYNSGILNSYSGVTFAGNYTGATGLGGAIYNTDASAVATMDGNTFKYNGYSNYNSGTDTATTVTTKYGGAIYNTTSGKVSITNSTINNNAATSDGGAIWNDSAVVNALNIGTSGGNDTTKFINNRSTTGVGGAIYNTGTLNSYNGVTFAGNYTASDGGAVFNYGATGILTIDGNTFKYNGYSNYNDTNGTASTIATQRGGAIATNVSSKIYITNSNFSNNASTSGGGAIYGYGGTTVTLGISGSTDTTSFANNKSNGNGGAIYNRGIVNSYNGVSFAGNYAGAARGGGAIFNTGATVIAKIIGNTFKYNGYSNYTSPGGVDTASTVLTQNGGAIYNDTAGAVLKISNTSFTNNAVLGNGGAIYNNAGTTAYIQGDGVGKQTLFQGNLAAGVSNAIYLAGTDSTTNASNLYLNAGNSGKIVSYDGISGSNKDYNFININSSNATAKTSFIDGTTVLTSGEVDLYGNISDVTINNSAGITNVGRASNPVIASTNSLWNILGGTVNVNNTAFSGTSSTAGGVISNTAGMLNIGTSGLTDASTFINCSSSASNGGAIYNTSALNIYKGVTFAGNYVNGTHYGGAIMNVGASAIANIDGNTFKWNGYSNYNFGTDTATTISTQNGGAIYNDTSGTINITKSIFNNNSATNSGGAIYNSSGTINIGTSGSTDTTSFINNYSTNPGGAIRNIGTLNSYGGVTFAGNYNSAGGVAGAIYNIGASAVATIIGNTFKWNGYSDYNSATDTATAVLTIRGGAIYNTASGKTSITNSTFSNNAATSQGGSIWNDSTVANALVIGTSGSTDTTTFTNNKANSSGGAIYNMGSLKSYNGTAFAGNYTAGLSSGGALFNTGAVANATIIGNTFKWNGYSNYNSGTDTATTVSTQNGGAIFNDTGSVLKITNSSFANNAVSGYGGAILNNSGATTYLQADGAGKQTLFQGNKANGISNAIYLNGIDSTTNASNLYLNAGNSSTITSYDSITSSNAAYNNIYINSSDATASTSFIDGSTILKNGTVNLYDDVTGATVYDYAGTTNFGNSSAPKTACYNGTIFNLSGGVQNFNNGITSATINSTGGTQNLNNSLTGSSLTINGGTLNVASTGSIASTALNLTSGNLNLVNGITDTVALTDFNANAAGTLSFDVDLDTGINDKITVSGVASGELVSSINITQGSIDPASPLTLITGSNISGLTLKDTIATYTTYNKYIFIGSNNGTYNVTMEWSGGLNSAVSVDTLPTRAFSAIGDTTITDSLGPMGLANSTLNIYGNGHNINGIGYAGISTTAGQTLNISGVGSTATNKSWNGFISTNGGAINNSGTTSIKNSIFSSNSATANGGVAYNNLSGTLNIGTSSTTDASLFANNSSTNDGGAIYNKGTLNSNKGVTYAGNYSGNTNSGGAIYNTDSTATATFNNNTFKYNGYSDYTSPSGIDTASTVSTLNGGSIYNTNSATVNVSNSTFTNNASSLDGGAIYNIDSAKAYIAGSTFSNNTAGNNGGTIYNANSATANISNSTFTNNASSLDGGAIYNTDSAKAYIAGSTFSNNTAGNNGGAIFNANSATANISNSNFINNVATSNGGSIYNINSAKAYITGSNFSNNTASNNGGAIYNDSTAIIENSSFTNNTATTGKGGAIYNTGSATLNIIADNAAVSFTGNKANGVSNAIYLDATSNMNINAGNTGSISFNDKIVSANLNEININKPAVLKADGVSTAPTNGTVNLNNNIENSTINLYNGTLALGADNYLNNNNLNLNGGDLSLMNNAVGTMSLNALQINAPINLKIDADLAAGTADYLTAHSVSGTGSLNLSRINLLSDSKTPTNIPIADTLVRNYVHLDTTTAESAIYKYNLSYNSSTGAMNFVNTQEFTPSIITPQVSAMVGSYLTQTNTYHEALGNLDSIMFMPKLDRLLYTSKNKTASTDGTFVFSPLMLHEDTKGLWCKQFSTFENVPLNNGPNVSNVGYGALIGGDTELTYLGKGFTGYLTPYAGYSGSHQNYGNVGTYQNGGIVGLTGTVYKNDFFLALTANMSANNGTASTTSGEDNFTTLVAGLAAKAGYNYEIMHGKVIIQPSFMMAYTFAKTFDYSTSSGANITSDPLNAIQLSPGLKVIGNLKDGWQPYLGVNMVWNIMDTMKFYANDAQLPQMSVAPYLEYGIGVQRKWGERFSGFGQAMLRGGGRNGIALQFGFRYSLGK